MFLKKLIKAIDVSQPEVQNNQDPIYIIGASPLAIFLGASLQNSGENVTLLSTKSNCEKLQEGFILKEEHSLQKKLYQFQTTSHINKEPKLIILAAESHNLKSHLTFLPGKTYPNTPVLCFNHINHREVICPLLGINYHQAYISGYLQTEGNTVTVQGRSPKVTISKTHIENKPDIIYDLFSPLDISLNFNEQDKFNYWQHFAPHAIGFLYSPNQKTFIELFKDKKHKEQISIAATELSLLISEAKVKLSSEEIIRSLSETPPGFSYKPSQLTKNAEAAELDQIYTPISELARISKHKFPTLNTLMRTNYKTIIRK